MAKNREGSIDLFGAVQAKTEDGIVVHADGIAVEYDANGKPTKTLAQAIADGSLGGGNSLEVIDVEELPPATIELEGTEVPSSGQVGKVYFNTKLSVEEVNAILSELEYVEGVLFAPAVAVATTTDMSQGIGIMGIIEESGSAFIITTGDGQNIYEYDSGDTIENGWKMSEYDLNIDNMLEAVASQVGMTIQNSALKNLISITPFEEPNTDIELDKLYRTPIKEGGEWVGTTVPNSGTVEKVYFNTELSVEEVETILNTLTYHTLSSDVLGYSLLCFGNDNLYQKLLVVVKQNTTLIIMDYIDSKIYWSNEKNTDVGITNIGWQEFDNPIEINAEVLNSIIIVETTFDSGEQNDKLTSLFSTTPFTQVGGGTVGYKYNQFVNGEWKELGSGGDSGISKEEVNTLISEYMSANYDNGDTEEF